MIDVLNLVSKLDENRKSNKFDAVFSNPPYQTSNSQEESKTGIQKSPVNIFQHFQYIADGISQSSSMIYPGGRWASKTGRGMDDFGDYLANSRNLHNVIYFARTLKIFPGVEVSGGVTIVHVNKNKDNNGEWNLKTFHNETISEGKVELPGESTVSLFPIIAKLEKRIRESFMNDFGDDSEIVDENNDSGVDEKDEKVSTQREFKSINSRKLSFSAYKIKSDFALENADKVVVCEADFSNKPSDNHIRLLVNNAHGKGGRATWFWVDKKEIDESVVKYVDQWKVVISAKNINGVNGRNMQVEVFPPDTAHSYVRVTIGLFNTENEANNFMKYLSTDFGRCLLVASGGLMKSFACQLPDFDNFENLSNGIDFNLPVNKLNDALCLKFGLNEDDKMEMENFVSTLAGFGK